MIVDAVGYLELNIKTILVKLTFNLAFRCECFSPFQGTVARKAELTTAHSQLYPSLN